MKFTAFVYFPWRLEGVSECCEASSAAVLTSGRGRVYICVYLPVLPSVSTAVWVVAVKQHFAIHTKERNNCCCCCCRSPQCCPGCPNNECSVGKEGGGCLKHGGDEKWKVLAQTEFSAEVTYRWHCSRDAAKWLQIRSLLLFRFVL